MDSFPKKGKFAAHLTTHFVFQTRCKIPQFRFVFRFLPPPLPSQVLVLHFLPVFAKPVSNLKEVKIGEIRLHIIYTFTHLHIIYTCKFTHHRVNLVDPGESSVCKSTSRHMLFVLSCTNARGFSKNRVCVLFPRRPKKQKVRWA